MRISFQCSELLLFVCVGAWWEVDLGEAVDIKRVKVYNRFDSPDLVSHRLSNSTVSLIDGDGLTLKTYTIGNARNISEFDINFDYCASPTTRMPTSSPTSSKPSNFPTTSKPTVSTFV